jgi:hypothetical protein
VGQMTQQLSELPPAVCCGEPTIKLGREVVCIPCEKVWNFCPQLGPIRDGYHYLWFVLFFGMTLVNVLIIMLTFFPSYAKNIKDKSTVPIQFADHALDAGVQFMIDEETTILIEDSPIEPTPHSIFYRFSEINGYVLSEVSCHGGLDGYLDFDLAFVPMIRSR